eukprot:6212350-Pleurochrysis_carterae.AAC.2
MMPDLHSSHPFGGATWSDKQHGTTCLQFVWRHSLPITTRWRVGPAPLVIHASSAASATAAGATVRQAPHAAPTCAGADADARSDLLPQEQKGERQHLILKARFKSKEMNMHPWKQHSAEDGPGLPGSPRRSFRIVHARSHMTAYSQAEFERTNAHQIG